MLEENGTCQLLCHSYLPQEDSKFMNDRIREDYALNWIVDGLPAAEMKVDLKTGDMFFDMGFNLGNDEPPYSDEKPVVNNHYDIVLRCVRPLRCARTCAQLCSGITNPDQESIELSAC